VSRTETGGRYEIDGCEFGSVKAHSLGGVEHFAFAGIVNENLKLVRAFLNHYPQFIPFGFVSLPVPIPPSVSHTASRRNDGIRIFGNKWRGLDQPAVHHGPRKSPWGKCRGNAPDAGRVSSKAV